MRFSVIIPLYNKAPYVEKALRSVFAQTFIDFELIVVDDGSKDGSAEIVEGIFASEKSRSNANPSIHRQNRIIRQANAGVSTARNNGVAAAQGEYVCFLDADDWWEPGFLEGMDGLINNFPEARLYATSYYYVKYGRKLVKLDIPTGYFNYFRVYAQVLCQPVWTGAACMRRETFNEFGGFKPHLKLGEDFELWSRIALRYSVAFLNTPLSNYNQDVDVTFRGTHHVHNPKVHMLWNLDFLEAEEKTNPDIKQLMDRLRVYGMQKHYLSKEYHEAAKEQLVKVDWSRQPKKWQQFYNAPLWYLRAKRWVLQWGVRVKRIYMLYLSK